MRIIPPEEVTPWLPIIGPMLAPAVDLCHGEVTLHQVLTNLMIGGSTRLMIMQDGEDILAAIVLSIHNHPAKRIMQVSFAGGTRMEDWAEQGLPFVEKLAQELGCNSVYIQGRPGWLRKFEKLGYSNYGILTGKELGR
jgi:hypothetical protein